MSYMVATAQHQAQSVPRVRLRCELREGSEEQYELLGTETEAM